MGMKTGTSTGGIETSKRYRAKQRRRRASEEQRWAALAGPVEVRSAPRTVEDDGQGVKDQAGL